jgi:molecular chaperone HtpG
MTATERIPFQVEVQRIIEVLATQIYQSPLALLRENAQNAFDAIMLRKYKGDSFEPLIALDISPSRIVITDNGIGMTPDELRRHYWSAGSSSKNTPEARAAGVVGTFGIGAMANFGVADVIEVKTESAVTGQRTRSVARRETLSLTEDCIELEAVESTATPGTTVTAEISPSSPIDVSAAERYIGEFVAYLAVPVMVNGQLSSRKDLRGSLASDTPGWEITLPDASLGDLVGAVTVRIAAGTGEASVEVDELRIPGGELPGKLVFRQGMNTIRSYRSGFGLAVFGLASAYQFGGAVDLSVLEPTAGREALSTGSMQLLQNAMTAADRIVSEALADRPESDLNTSFMSWVQSYGRYELCNNLAMRVEPNRPRTRLAEVRSASLIQPLRVYGGGEPTLIESLASEDAPLYVLAGSNPRRQCEAEYLRQFCQAEYMADAPTLLSTKPYGAWTIAEQALVFRIVSLLQSDYFLTVDVRLGELSHGLPVLLINRDRPNLYLDPRGSTFDVLVSLYNSDYSGFGSMVKDFVRTIVFPQVSGLVPSSTRQGAEAFLKSIKRTRDLFEYEYDDLEDFKSIWADLMDGRLSLGEAATFATATASRNSQVLEAAAAMQVRDVVPDIITNEEVLVADETINDLDPLPAIMRTEVDTEAKLLTISESDTSLKGYRCFLALSDKAREQRGDFFLQPHRTSIVWGGQRILFVFEHHSGAFGLYYDLQTSEPVTASSGGGPYPTSTMLLGNRIFIPVPDTIASTFIPGPNDRKQFGVKCDLIYSGSEDLDGSTGLSHSR